VGKNRTTNLGVLGSFPEFSLGGGPESSERWATNTRLHNGKVKPVVKLIKLKAEVLDKNRGHLGKSGSHGRGGRFLLLQKKNRLFSKQEGETSLPVGGTTNRY